MIVYIGFKFDVSYDTSLNCISLSISLIYVWFSFSFFAQVENRRKREIVDTQSTPLRRLCTFAPENALFYFMEGEAQQRATRPPGMGRLADG